jgi:hypothetical protein
MNVKFPLPWMLAICLVCGCGRSGKSRNKEASLEDLNNALVVWLVTKPNLPQDVSELTNSLSMQGKRLPKPPPGKKLAVDPDRRQVIWVDQ